MHYIHWSSKIITPSNKRRTLRRNVSTREKIKKEKKEENILASNSNIQHIELIPTTKVQFKSAINSPIAITKSDHHEKENMKPDVIDIEQSIPNTSTQKSTVTEKVSTNLVNLELNTISSKVLMNGQPTHGDTITLVISRLRSKGINDVFLCNSSFCPLSMRSGEDNWDRAKNYFRSGRAQQKVNGFYLIPVYLGKGKKDKVGHYTLCCLHVNNSLITGHILDSLNTCHNPSVFREFRTIKKIFISSRHTFLWRVWSCVQQSELECGVRVLYSMIQICKGISLQLNHQAILQYAANISTNAQQRSNTHVRSFIASVVNNSIDWWTRIIHDLSVSQVEELSDTQEIVDLTSSKKRKYRGHRRRDIWGKRERNLGQRFRSI